MSEQQTGTRLVARATAKIALSDPPYAAHLRAGHHELVADEGRHGGGGDTGPSPFDLVLSGLGACTAITLRMYAERKQWALTAVTVEMNYFRDDKAFRIERVLRLEGALDADQRARLADIAERTPVTLALKAGAAINTKLV
jgi:putative redox protein